jgi:hypothetical protein
MIFFLNSIDYGSTRNLGFNPLQETLLVSEGKGREYLASVIGISN